MSYTLGQAARAVGKSKQRVLDLLPRSTHELPVLLAASFGPLVLVSGLTYLLLRLSASECLTSLADGWT